MNHSDAHLHIPFQPSCTHLPISPPWLALRCELARSLVRHPCPPTGGTGAVLQVWPVRPGAAGSPRAPVAEPNRCGSPPRDPGDPRLSVSFGRSGLGFRMVTRKWPGAPKSAGIVSLKWSTSPSRACKARSCKIGDPDSAGSTVGSGGPWKKPTAREMRE